METSEGKRIAIYCAVVAVLIAAIVVWWRWSGEQIPAEPTDLKGDFFAPKGYTYKQPGAKPGPVVSFDKAITYLTSAPTVFIGELSRSGSGYVVKPTNTIKADQPVPPSLTLSKLPANLGDVPDNEPLPVLVRVNGNAHEVVRLNPSLAETAYFVKRQLPADPLKDITLDMLLLEHRWDQNGGRDVIVGLFVETKGQHVGNHVEIVVTEDSGLDGEVTGLPVVLTRFRGMEEQRALSCPSYGAWRLLQLLNKATGLPTGAAAKRVEGEVIIQRFNWMKAAFASCIALPNDEATALGIYRRLRAERLQAELVSPVEVLEAREAAAKAAKGEKADNTVEIPVTQ